MGGFGTATYVDGDVVVGFGHPLVGGGLSGFDLANALVYGVWPGDYGPEKIFSPGAVAGTVTQDRSAGIAGRLDATPTQVPITSTVTFGGKSVTSTSAMPQWAIDSSDWSYFADVGPWVAMLMATRQDYLVGSATTTTTVIVSDGTGDHMSPCEPLGRQLRRHLDRHRRPRRRPVRAHPEQSTASRRRPSSPSTSTADLSPVHQGARILDVSVPGGLKPGLNQVHDDRRRIRESRNRRR